MIRRKINVKGHTGQRKINRGQRKINVIKVKNNLCQIQVKAHLHFQLLKVKFLLKSSILPPNRVGFGSLLSGRNFTFNFHIW